MLLYSVIITFFDDTEFLVLFELTENSFILKDFKENFVFELGIFRFNLELSSLFVEVNGFVTLELLSWELISILSLSFGVFKIKICFRNFN